MEKKFTLKRSILLTASMLFFSHAFAQVPAYLPANIKAWYPFTGNANDESPNGLNLTKYYTTLTNDRWGNANSAYQFDGIGSRMERPSFPLIATSPIVWTMSAWFKADTTVSACIFQHGKYNSGTNTSTVFVVANSSIVGSNTYSGAVPINCNNAHPSGWTHVAVENDGNAFYLYMNGAIVCTQPTTNAPSGGNLTIGADYVNNVLGDYFKGSIDDIAIYHYGLTACKVKEIYQTCTLTQPQNQYAVVGTNATISLTNSCWDATGITYQWQADNGGGFNNVTNAGPFTGATTSALNIANVTLAMNNTQYKCIINSGCSSKTTSVATLTVTTTIGINDLTQNNTVSLYPNPGNGNFTLNYELSLPEAVFNLCDVAGKTVYTFAISNKAGVKSFDLSSLSNGIYFWNISHKSATINHGKVSIIK